MKEEESLLNIWMVSRVADQIRVLRSFTQHSPARYLVQPDFHEESPDSTKSCDSVESPDSIYKFGKLCTNMQQWFHTMGAEDEGREERIIQAERNDYKEKASHLLTVLKLVRSPACWA